MSRLYSLVFAAVLLVAAPVHAAIFHITLTEGTVTLRRPAPASGTIVSGNVSGPNFDASFFLGGQMRPQLVETCSLAYPACLGNNLYFFAEHGRFSLNGSPSQVFDVLGGAENGAFGFEMFTPHFSLPTEFNTAPGWILDVPFTAVGGADTYYPSKASPLTDRAFLQGAGTVRATFTRFVDFLHPDGIQVLGSATYTIGPVVEQVTFTPVPEPATLLLLGSGLVLVRGRRRQ